jgi:hypothetical protein
MLLGADVEPVVKLTYQPAGYYLFAGAGIDAVIRDEPPYALEVVTKVCSGMEAASQFSQAQRAADYH